MSWGCFYILVQVAIKTVCLCQVSACVGLSCYLTIVLIGKQKGSGVSRYDGSLGVSYQYLHRIDFDKLAHLHTTVLALWSGHRYTVLKLRYLKPQTIPYVYLWYE